MGTRSGSVEAIALLPLPEWADLSEPQVRGKACVWCAATLHNGSAVDLGTRRIPVLDGHLRTFPRACRPCTRAHIIKTEAAHRATCEQCVTAAASVEEATACDTAQALHHLLQECDR